MMVYNEIHKKNGIPKEASAAASDLVPRPVVQRRAIRAIGAGVPSWLVDLFVFSLSNVEASVRIRRIP
ncbi:MAG: hypothetical protein ACK4RK_18180 [Gemmataceae bacterium]